MKKQGKHRYKMMLLVILLLASMLAACTPGTGGSANEPQLLRIATLYGGAGNEGYLRSELTDVYEYTQGVDVEIMYAIDQTAFIYSNQTDEQPDPLTEMKKLMEGDNPPDVVLIDYGILEGLIQDNMLVQLDTNISDDNIDLDAFAPSVIEGLRSVGNNQLYALAPTFSSSALIYNRGLFQESGTPFPEDNMNWQEVFDLARRVTSGEGSDRTYGFGFTKYRHDDMFYNLMNYTAPLQLQMIDDSGDNMMVDSEQWANVWRTLIDLYDAGVMPNANEMRNEPWDDSQPFYHDLFLSGRLAMTLVQYGELDEIINVNSQADTIDGYEAIDWDVVTFPFHPEAPGIGAGVSMSPVMGINARAQNAELAWDFIKFIHSEEWAQLKSRSSYQLMTRTEHNEPKGGLSYNMDAFFALKPPSGGQQLTNLYLTVPNIWEIQQIGQMKFNEVLADEKTIEQALAEWQNEGNAMLQQSEESGGDVFEGAGGAISEDAVIIEGSSE